MELYLVQEGVDQQLVPDFVLVDVFLSPLNINNITWQRLDHIRYGGSSIISFGIILRSADLG